MGPRARRSATEAAGVDAGGSRRRIGQMRRDANSPVGTTYTYLFGLLGWAVLLLATLIPGVLADAPVAPDRTLFVVFLAVVVAARLMAFGLYGEAVVSLDAAFYVAATVCLGLVVASWLVAVS